ncbi:MAG: HNH/endonuclease VII fold putative polymorphic toxin [Cellulosilyticaceae bacterium]
MNLYAYCSNNPVSYYDPTGYAKEASPLCKTPAVTDADGGDTKGGSNPNINRKQALNKAKDSASIPRSQQPTRQWTIGDDITKKGVSYKNYEYSDNATHHGRYYEYDTTQGKKIIVEHTNDLEQGLHTHAGEVPKEANPLTYDFKNPDNRYKPINKDTDHHIRYTDE